ncbi:MAG: polyhydroxyalkanoic acid system family protein [Cellvibrionaceae bacterium]|nr:polyhydroxyalkanoic acid system family protein [Cellvibrionaceae bacterium]MCV6626803.1 polyhydroxyalkanoic acid system family protein [Cellvibrionaceae bacterium]
MARINIKKPFTMPRDEVKNGMKEIAEHLCDEHGMKYRWCGEERIEFSHKAGKGSLQVEGQEVVLELKLSLLFAAAAPLVKKHVHQFADEYIY